MDEEPSNDPSMSPKESPGSEFGHAETMLGLPAKNLQGTPADMEKLNRRIRYMKQSLKTYEILKKNVYLGRKKRVPTEDDIFVCDCIKADPSEVQALQAVNTQISYNCGDKCINRYMCTECEVTSCPCEEYCLNRRFQIHQDAKVYPKPCEGKGLGLFAGETIKKGQFIMQYIGEVYSVTCEEAQIRIEAYSKSTCTYLMKISSNEVIDPTFKGNMARFINHSCDPNCITQKWNVLGETCVGIFAIRDLPEDTELSFDYQFDSFRTPLTKCLCGAYNCKGYLGRKPHEMSLEEWEEKLEYLPCSICGQNVEDDEEKLIQCESCHEAYHIFCLDPPMKRIPKESWWCDKCKVKQETQEKLKKNFNPLEMNRKLYETVKKKMGKFQSIEMKQMMYQSSSDEEDPKYTQEYEKIYRLQKRLEVEAMREQYTQSDEEEDITEMKIKKKLKSSAVDDAIAAAAAADQEKPSDDSKMDGQKLEGKSESQKFDKSELQRPHKSKVAEFKEKAHAIFNEKIKEIELWSQILEIERKNGETYGLYGNHGDRVEVDRRSKMINSIQLDIIKKNQIVFRRIGTRLFWEHHSGRVNMYKKNIETTIMGNRDQLRVTELVFDLLEYIADEVERMRGQREAKVRLPAMFLRKIIGTYHNQHAAELENRYEVSINYSREYLNDECYPLTLVTDIKIKGVKDNLISVYRHVNHKIKKLKVRRLYCNRRDYTTLLQNLNIIRRKIHPTELRFNKTKEGALKELNHPFYYIQYKDREVALIGTEREISEAEKILEDTFKDAHSGSDEAEFGCVHYLWPTTNMNQQIMQQYKGEIEREVTGTRFVYFEPIVPRKNMTLSIFGSFKEIERAKEMLKAKLEALKSTSLSLEAFQEHVKYQMLKYLFKCLHNFFITGNIADIKFWDLQSVEFEKISDMTPLRKQVLRNIFTKDMNFQIYVLFVCDFSRNQFFNIMKLSNRSTVDLLRKFVQNILNSNNHLLSRMKCESVLRHDREPSPYNRRNGGSYNNNNYSSRDQLSDKGDRDRSDRGGRRSGERSATKERGQERDRSTSRDSRSDRHRSRLSRDDSQNNENQSNNHSRRDMLVLEEYKDQDARSKSPLPPSSDDSRIQRSASQLDKSKFKDRVPQFSDEFIHEKSQSEKAHPYDVAGGDRNAVKKSESEKREEKTGYRRRSKSKERSRSRSKRSSRSKSPSRSGRQDHRTGGKRHDRHDKSHDYKRSSTNDSASNQHSSNYYEKNPNFGKDFNQYISQNEKEVGYYERMLMNKTKQDASKKKELPSGSLSRDKSKSRERSKSRSRDRTRRKEKSRSRNRSKSHDRNQNRNRNQRRDRSRSKSGSRNRNRRRGQSRSTSNGRGGDSRNKSSRNDKKGRFDVEPSARRNDKQEMNTETGWQRDEGGRNQRNQNNQGQNFSGNQNRTNIGLDPQSFNPEVAIRYVDLRRQQEQLMAAQANMETNINSRIIPPNKDEAKWEAVDVPKTNFGQEDAYNQFNAPVQGASNLDLTSNSKQNSNHKSRFSYAAEPVKVQQNQNESNYLYQQSQQNQQASQYYPQFSNYQQQQQQMQSQPQNFAGGQNHNQQQNSAQFYSQSQDMYQQNVSQSQQQSQLQLQQQQQLKQRHFTTQNQNPEQYQDRQQAQSTRRIESGNNVSRFSSKPYTSGSNEFSRSSRDNPDTQDRPRIDNDRRYRDEQDSSRDSRNKPRVFESENYKKTQNTRTDSNKKYQDSSYNQPLSSGGAKYLKVQENAMGKKIIVTKSNSLNQNQNQNSYYSNNGDSYKDRHREAGTRDN